MERKEMSISCLSAYIDQEKTIWIASSEINAVFMQKGGSECEYLFSLNEVGDMNTKILKIYKRENTIYLFENNRYCYWKYDLSVHELTKHIYFDKKSGYITDVIIEGSRAWVFPWDFNLPICIISLDDESVCILEWDIKYVDSNTTINSNNLKGTSLVGSYYCNGHIYTANRNESSIYVLDINCLDCSIQGRKIDDARRINAIAAFENKVFILCLDQNSRTMIKEMDFSSGEIVDEINLSQLITIHNQRPLEYNRMVYWNNKLLVFSVEKKEVIVICNMSIVTTLKDADDNSLDMICNDYQICNNACYIFSNDGIGVSRIVNVDNGFAIDSGIAYVEESKYEEALKDSIWNKKLIKESSCISLRSYLGSIC